MNQEELDEKVVGLELLGTPKRVMLINFWKLFLKASLDFL
jgi:hypothetical protein|tara:strand:+ start:511 stop:630 length:120 start_codon:yes stop_codon:yes gene_type:complete